MGTVLARDFTVVQGLPFPGVTDRARWYWKPGGVPMNYSGLTATLTIKVVGTSTPLLVLTSSSGITLNSTTGFIGFVLTEAQTAALPVGALAYDLEVGNNDYTQNFATGTMRVVASQN